MSSLTAWQLRAILSLVATAVALVAGIVGIYRSDRATTYALRLTSRSDFHRAVKLVGGLGFAVIVAALLNAAGVVTDIPVLSGPRGYEISLGALLVTGGVLFGYANVELLASLAEFREHPSSQKDEADSMLDSWRRSTHRYNVWRCLMWTHHDGAYWAFVAVSVLFVPGSLSPLFMNNLLGLILLVSMLTLGAVSLFATIAVSTRWYTSIDYDDIEGVDTAVEEARSNV